ncbi:MAG: RNA methyltransferase [Betaproteobacteria bacterium]
MMPPLRPAITSRDNPLLRRLSHLLSNPTGYRRGGEICMEGEHLCSAYLARGHRPGLAVFSESAWQRLPLRELASGAGEVQWVADRLLAQISSLPSPAGVVFVAEVPANGTPDPFASAVLLDRVQDPGNVGSILRSASALGVRQLWTTLGTAALWSPKVLRAGMGAHFGLNLCEGVDVTSLTAGLHRAGAARSEPRAQGAQGTQAASGSSQAGSERAPWVATSSHSGDLLGQLELPAPCVWVLGHEGQGVAPELLQRCQLTVRIPQPGGEESLNVAAAAAICLYESARQRRS